MTRTPKTKTTIKTGTGELIFDTGVNVYILKVQNGTFTLLVDGDVVFTAAKS
jgi:hypothetical protein